MKKVKLLIFFIILWWLTAPTMVFEQESWAQTSTGTNVPTPRSTHTAVWTGTKMIVWGGNGINTGGIYDPSNNTWTPTSTINAPSPRNLHKAIWTGNRMIVWGGSLNTGGIFDPLNDIWTATSTINAPSIRQYHTAVWTGSKMIVWGGVNLSGTLNTGGVYNPSTNKWRATSTINAPSPRELHTAVWTGSVIGGKMIVWGGWNGNYPTNTGGIYDPETDTWTPIETINAPSVRDNHTAVWTGSKMIVWGGFDSGELNTGGIYEPITNTWTETSTSNAPSARDSHTAVWTGNKMIVWGGYASGWLNTGGIYNPITDTWAATSIINVPSPRYGHTAVWTGSVLGGKMIVWGGWNYNIGGELNTGGIYSNSSLTEITNIDKTLPKTFSLSQNYPNPFNLSTKIKFDLPKEGFVKLIIYDVLGKEASTLVNEELNAGVYETEWDASEFSSGIYFYKIFSGLFTETKKMLLTK